MAKNSRAEADPPPTMIIPRGTDIQVDSHGQLSVRAPGNLVIQNSGHYGNLESVSGSIRIEPEVEVEAVSVSCPETCYVQGNLTAWKVSARTLHLEDTAKAHIVLQDTQRLEIGKGARLVGNFRSEKELFFLFSRFSSQMRSLPVYREGAADGGEAEVAEPLLTEWTAGAEEEPPPEPPPPAARGRETTQELAEPLFFALMLLERGRRKGDPSPEDRRILQELIKLLEQGDLETLRHTHKTLFGRIREATDEVRRSRELIADFFAKG